MPLVASDELLGLLIGEGTSEVDLARAVANQTAVAIKKIELIERLTEKNLIKDFFEQLAAAAPLGDARGPRRAARLRPRPALTSCSPRPRRTTASSGALARSRPGSLFDRRDDSIRALAARSRRPASDRLVDEIRRDPGASSSRRSRSASRTSAGAPRASPPGFEEARHALARHDASCRRQPGVMAYEELGPYKYLLRMSLDADVRDAHRDAVARLAEYDRQRSTSLLPTLEEFLRRRGNISATAEALYVHPNTLRQRLRRIMELSGIDLRRDDWLMVEIARQARQARAGARHGPPAAT